MTVGLYARSKKWPLENISVEIALSGALTSEQRAKLMEIAAKCPVHRTLKSEINIRLRTAPTGSLRQIGETKIQ